MTNTKIFCLECGEEMREETYETPLKVLKKRVWYVCAKCKSSINKDEFWKKINTV